MTITKGQFRWLLTASIAIPILGFIVSVAGASALPTPLREYVAAQGDANFSKRDIFISALGIPLLIATVASFIGLYRFRPFARPLTVIACIACWIFQIFDGPIVNSGLTSSLYDMGSMLSGIILAVIYLTPAKAWFERGNDT